MSALIFDSGPLISLTLNNLLWILPELKKQFKGEFYLPESVKTEVVEDALNNRRFRFNALQVQELIRNKTFTVIPDTRTKKETIALLEVANSCFQARGRNLVLLHYAEVSSIIAAQQLNAPAIVMDERITRELIEHPKHLDKLMEKKLHTSVHPNHANIARLQEQTRNIMVLRSTELAAVAFEKGLLQRFYAPKIPNSKHVLLEGILWGLKMNGAAINNRGIKAIMRAVST